MILFQYSFDEATQRATEVLPLDAPHEDHRHVIAVLESVKKPFKTIVSLVHSMVMSVRLAHYSVNGDVIDRGEAVIPPVHVETQDAKTIGKTIIKNVETRVMGLTVRRWIQELALLNVVLLIVLMSADSASANLSCMLALRALHCVSVSIFSYWHFEPCGVHQLMRSTVKLSHLSSQKQIMKSQSKLLKSRYNRKCFEKRTLEVFVQNFEHNGVSLTPPEEERRAREVKSLVDLLCHRVSAHKHLGELREDAAKSMGVAEKAFEQFLDFCNNSVPSSGTWGRRDPNMTAEESVAEAQELLRLTLFQNSIPAYNEARILRYLDCCLFWARWHALCPFAKQIWDSVQFAQCKKVGQEADNLRQENSVRLQRARSFASNPRCRTLSLIFFSCMQVTEGLVHLLFYLNTDAMDVVSDGVDEATQRDSVGAINSGTNKAAKRRRKKKKTGMGSVVDAVERHCAELWSWVVGNAAEDNLHGMAQSFLPPECPREEVQGCLRFSASCMLAEVVHRFMLRHRNLPHATFPDGNGKPVSVETCTAALAGRTCCKRNVKALLDHAAAAPPGTSPEKVYSQIMSTLDVEVPGTTIPAEKMNAEQRFNSMGAQDRRPTGFARQAAAHVAVHSHQIWMNRGGPTLSLIRIGGR